MVWDKPADLRANTAYAFRFRLLNASGQPAGDVRPYLGMAGHAAFVKTDGTVFAPYASGGIGGHAGHDARESHGYE